MDFLKLMWLLTSSESKWFNMHIETEPINFKFPTVSQMIRQKLSDLQIQYLAQLESGSTIQELIQNGLKNGWLVNFVELYKLIQTLVELNLVHNKNFYNYFSELKGHSENSVKKTQTLSSPVKKSSDEYKKEFKELIKLPFLRSLDSNIAMKLLEESTIVDFPPESLICKKDDVFSRSLYILLEGEAAIYGQGEHTKRFVSLLKPNNVFGEMGFFLGVPRTADIVAVRQSKVLIITGSTDFIEKNLNMDKAEHLVHRFWIQQALLNSEIFKSIPSESLDELTFGGQIVRTLENQILFNENDMTNGAYIVVQGQFSVSIGNKVVAKISQGQMIGEISLFKTQGKRTATVVADKDSVLMHITLQKFYYLMSQNLYLAKTLQDLSQARFEKNKGGITPPPSFPQKK